MRVQTRGERPGWESFPTHIFGSRVGVCARRKQCSYDARVPMARGQLQRRAHLVFLLNEGGAGKRGRGSRHENCNRNARVLRSTALRAICRTDTI